MLRAGRSEDVSEEIFRPAEEIFRPTEDIFGPTEEAPRLVRKSPRPIGNFPRKAPHVSAVAEEDSRKSEERSALSEGNSRSSGEAHGRSEVRYGWTEEDSGTPVTLPDSPEFSSVGRKTSSVDPKKTSEPAEMASVGRAGRPLDRSGDPGRFGAELGNGGPGEGRLRVISRCAGGDSFGDLWSGREGLEDGRDWFRRPGRFAGD
jgi:hypothetical protein